MLADSSGCVVPDGCKFSPPGAADGNDVLGADSGGKNCEVCTELELGFDGDRLNPANCSARSS